MLNKRSICCYLSQLTAFWLFFRQTNTLVLYRSVRDVYSAPHWKRGRAVEGTGLENRRPERVLEFESLRFRQIRNPSRYATWVFCFLSVSIMNTQYAIAVRIALVGMRIHQT